MVGAHLQQRQGSGCSTPHLVVMHVFQNVEKSTMYKGLMGIPVEKKKKILFSSLKFC